MALYQLTDAELDAVNGGTRSGGGDRTRNTAIVIGANVIVRGSADTEGYKNSGGQYLSQTVVQSSYN